MCGFSSVNLMGVMRGVSSLLRRIGECLRGDYPQGPARFCALAYTQHGFPLRACGKTSGSSLP